MAGNLPLSLSFQNFLQLFKSFCRTALPAQGRQKLKIGQAAREVGFRIFVCENTLGSVPFSQENRCNFRQVSARPGIIFFVEGHLDYGYRRLEISRKVRRVKGYLQERILRRMPDSHISSILCSSYASSGK
jgi:hypothetical protein